MDTTTLSFPKKLNATVSNSPRTEDYKVQNIIATQLNSQGFNEMMANSLTTASYVQLSEMLKEEHNVIMLNPLSNDLAAMRQSLLFSGLEALSYNINRRNSDLKFFEFGKTYHNFKSGYEEHKHLTMFTTGNRNQESWTNTQKTKRFLLIQRLCECRFGTIGHQKTQNLPMKSDIFSEGIAIGFGNDILVEYGVVKNQSETFRH
jgi:phenylalanyl-tRNA synthetase beta chain